MIGYITLGTSDIKRGASFYDAIGKEMDTPRMMGSEADGFIAWGNRGIRPGCPSFIRMTAMPCPWAMAAWSHCRPMTRTM